MLFCMQEKAKNEKTRKNAIVIELYDSKKYNK